MKKSISDLCVALLLVFVSSVVVAWGYQVFWNDVVLNVWQLFTSSDVLTTMRIPYGVCLAIAWGIVLIYNKKADESVGISEAVGKVMVKMITKIISIGVTLLVVSMVF